MSDKLCGNCEKKVESSWKYCRYCGAAQQTSSVVSDTIDPVNVTREVKESVIFDKKLYYDVMSTRSERTELIKKKAQLKEDIASLLEQLESGLISRDYALPKITDFKKQVTEVSEKEESFKDLPSQLPIEVLIDQIEDAKKRLKKIDELKNDPAITKDAIKEARKRAEDSLQLLKEEKSVITGHLKIWANEIEKELEENRKTLEQLYIKVKTGEIIEEEYENKKQGQAAKVANLSNISTMLRSMIN